MVGSETEGRRRWLTAYAPLVVWIGVILFLGSGQGSMSQTSLFVRPLLEFLFPAADELTLQLYHGYIRKLAHFTEYAILALLAQRAFAAVKHRFLTSIVLVILIASIDEFLQSFNSSRTSSALDALLDVSGGLFVILAAYLWTQRRLAQ